MFHPFTITVMTVRTKRRKTAKELKEEGSVEEKMEKEEKRGEEAIDHFTKAFLDDMEVELTHDNMGLSD